MKTQNKTDYLKNSNFILSILLIFALMIGLSACHNSGESGDEHGKREKSEKSEAKGERGHDEGREGGEEGEEDGTQLGIDETYEGVRNGVKMTLRYNAEQDAFVGTVTNITNDVVPEVRVEVHLSNKVELGPTPRANLAVGESRAIVLKAEGNKFETWSTHAESGVEEGHGNEDEGEHGGEGERSGGEHR